MKPSSVKKDLKEWERDVKQLAEQLRTRLTELDMERTRVRAILERLEPDKALPSNGGKRTPRPPVRMEPGRMLSPLGQTAIDVLQDAGEQGMMASEICEAVQEELGDSVRQDAILTFISRAKAKKIFKATGVKGSYRYFYAGNGTSAGSTPAVSVRFTGRKKGKKNKKGRRRR